MAETTSTANPEGIITISLLRNSEGFNARIHSERPLLASRLFEGKPLEKSLPLIPSLFSVCGQAQSVAAIRAVESSLGFQTSKAAETQRNLLVLIEGIREHLWRLLIDWPEMLGLARNAQQLAPLNQALTQLLASLNPDKHLTSLPRPNYSPADLPLPLTNQWHEARAAILSALYSQADVSLDNISIFNDGLPGRLLETTLTLGWESIGDLSLPALPLLPVDLLASKLSGPDNDRFIARPNWGDTCYETGPYARQTAHTAVIAARQQFGDGAYARMVARIAELLQWIRDVDNCLSNGVSNTDYAETSGQTGICQLEAVRGRLVHSMSVKDNHIAQFRILAPTEWNFHPQGVLAQMLSSLKPDEQAILKQQAGLLIKLIDPCVGYRLQFQTAQTGDSHNA